MSRLALSLLTRRVVMALALAAWLLGGAWHGAMQVQAALGDEVCTVDGAKRLPGGSPAEPAPNAAKVCPLCVAFSSPAVSSPDPAVTPHLLSGATQAPPLTGGAFVPASHLADLASRAPPRA